MSAELKTTHILVRIAPRVEQADGGLHNQAIGQALGIVAALESIGDTTIPESALRRLLTCEADERYVLVVEVNGQTICRVRVT